MTIYWERCGVCGRHYPTKTCWLNPELSVCMHCCFMCPLRSKCPNPVWLAELKPVEIAVPVEKPAAKPVEVEAPAARVEARRVEARRVVSSTEERRRKIKQLEELLRRLQEG